MIFSHRKIHGLRKCSKEKKGGDWDRVDGNGLKGWLDFSGLPQHLQAGRFPGGRHMALTVRERMVPLTVVNEEVRAIIGPSSIFLF